MFAPTIEVCPSMATGQAGGLGAPAVNAFGAEFASSECKPDLLSSINPIPADLEIIPQRDLSRLLPENIEASVQVVNQTEVIIVSGVEENRGSRLQGLVTARDVAERASQDDQMQCGVNPALKGLKSKSPASGKKPVSATKLISKVLPESTVTIEESTDEEVGEEEDSKEEDEESEGGEDDAETSADPGKNRKVKKRATPKRKAGKTKNSKQNRKKKIKVPVAERISAATNTRTAKKR